ncbi:hypothetical protein TrST_g9197 [Triparma strigata]|uniref:Ion transport domain-containing protein n=1 Tax=Triparma strigata TaxID=1606541 RepID=A0A9W7EFY3_9STRA|nr:hypothetical protein TrST_g9197 [Triparma strigata]
MGKPKASAVSSGSEDEEDRKSLTQGLSSSDVLLGMDEDQSVGRMSRNQEGFTSPTPPNAVAMPNTTGPEVDNEQEQERPSYSAPPEISEAYMSRDRTKTKEDIATESQYCHDVPGLKDPNRCRAILISPDQSTIFIADGDDDQQKGGLHVLQLSDGKNIAKFTFHESICCLAFPLDPDDPYKTPTKVYAGTSEGSIIVYDVEHRVSDRIEDKPTADVVLKDGKKEKRPYDEPFFRFGIDQEKSVKDVADLARAHEGRVYELTVSHDGKFLISVSEDKYVKIWGIEDSNTAPGLPECLFLQGDKIYSIDSLCANAYADKDPAWWRPSRMKKRGGGILNRDKARLPSQPKYMFCTGNRYGDIYVYYLRGKITGKDGKASGTSLFARKSKDGAKFTINTMDELTEWDDITEKPKEEEPSTMRIIKNAHKKSLYSLIFSEEGDRLYSGAYDTYIKIWDTASLSCLQTLVGHKDVVCSLALHGVFLCSGSYDKSIKLWHIETGTEVRTITGPVTQEDENAKNTPDNPEVHRESNKAVHLDRVNKVVFYKDGTNIISASTDKTVKRWNIAMNQEDARVLREWAFTDLKFGENEQIECMSVSGLNSKVVVTGGGFTRRHGDTEVHKHGIVRLWRDIDNIERVPRRTLDVRSSAEENSKEELPAKDVSTLLGSDYFSDTEGKFRHTDQVEDVVVSPDGTLALSIANDKQVICWDLTKATGKPPISSGKDCFVRKYDTKNRGHSIAITKDKKRFYVGVGEGILQEWKCDDNSKYVRQYRDENVKKGRAHKGWVMAIKLTKDDKKMVTGSHSSEVKIWDTGLNSSPEEQEEPKLLFSLGKGLDQEGNPLTNGHLAPVKDIEITPDDQKVASGSEDKTIKVWDIEKGTLLATLEGHEAEITSISIRAGGDYLASGSKDKTWKLWTLDTNDNERDPYKLVYTSSQGEGSLLQTTCVAFSADDSCLLSGSTDPDREDIFSSEKISMIFYHLPSVVQECMFKNDCSKEDEGTKLMDWKSSETTMTLRQEPHVICEPQIRHPIVRLIAEDEKAKKKSGKNPLSNASRDHSHHLKNLLHLAASDGRSNFIKSSIFYDLKTEAEQEKQMIALKALLMKDNDGKLPIDCAIEFKNGATVDIILQGFTRLLSQDFAKPFHNLPGASQEQHPSELFPLDSLCHALDQFPEEGLNFVSNLELVYGGDFLVQKGVKRFELPKTNRLIVGSELRIPQGFWRRTVGPDSKLFYAVQKEKTEKKGFLSSLFRCLKFLFCCCSTIFFILRPDEAPNSEDNDYEMVVRRNSAENGVSVPDRGRNNTAGDADAAAVDAEEEKKKDKDQVKQEEAKLRKNEYGNPVMAKFVPIKGIAAKDSIFLEKLTKAATSVGNYKAFENEVVRSVIEHKWDKFAKKMFLKHMYLYIIMVICMTVDAFLNKTLTNGTSWWCVLDTSQSRCEKTRDDKLGLDTLDDYQLLWRLPMLIAVGLWARFCWHELKQLHHTSLREHFDDIWNLLDFTSLGLMFLAYMFRVLYWFDYVGNTYTTVLLSFALPLTWLNMLYFLQGFDESGRLVRMILGIVQGTKFFLLILVVCMVGFAAGFFVLYENQSPEVLQQGDSRVEHISPTMSIFSSYTLMLGEFEVTDFPNTSFGEFVSAIILFCVFTFFINIIMLNLLIAIMGDIFDKVQESATAEFLFARTQIILEFEEMLKNNNAEWFPTWLQVLTPLHKSDNNTSHDADEWTGRVQKVTKTVNKLSEKIEEGRDDNKLFKEEQRQFREDVSLFMKEMRRQYKHSDTNSVRASVTRKQQIEVGGKRSPGKSGGSRRSWLGSSRK